MAWTKPSQGLIELLERSLPNEARIERRRMFGCPVVLLAGHMFAGVCQDQLFFRLAGPDRQALESAHGPHPFTPMPGRRSKTYVRAPDALLADEAALAALLARALSCAAALPPKAKKTKPPRHA